MRAVDGHALATGVLAGLLADHPPAADLAALRAELAAAARTDARVGKVLGFYAARLAEADRYLLAAVSLFARPVPARRCWRWPRMRRSATGWPGGPRRMVQAAVTGPAGRAGLLAPGRDHLRPSPGPGHLPAAWSWTPPAPPPRPPWPGCRPGRVTSRADALRVVEAIELLLDAGQWQPADDLYRNRTGTP